jgi:peptide/nickel transport system substrate-binding protein
MVCYVADRLMSYKTAVMDPSVGLGYEPISGLAVSAESPDAIIWSLKLRTDVKWHNVAPVNGRPFEAEDVKASWMRALTLKTNPFAGAIDMLDASQITVPAKDTVVFRLKYPFAPFPSVLAAITIGAQFPREALTGSYDPTKQVIGTGPFLFDHYTPDVEYVTRKNPEYYIPGQPYVDGTRTAIIPDQAQRLAQFIAGHLDDAPILPTDIDAAKKAVPNAQWLKTPPGGGTMLWYQLGDPTSPFQDIRVRQAFSMALDRDAIGKAVLGNDYEWGFVPDPSLGSKRALTPAALPPDVLQYYKYNPSNAKTLLEVAGASNMPVVIDFVQPYVLQGYVPAAEAVNNMLNAVGVKSALRQIDYTNEYLAGGKGEAYGNFPKDHIVFSGIRGGSTADPDGRLFDYFHSRSQVGAEHLKDPQLDAMIDKERTIVNQDERYRACLEIEQYLAAKVYFGGFLPRPYGYEALQPWVNNFNPGGYGPETVAKVWLDR